MQRGHVRNGGADDERVRCCRDVYGSRGGTCTPATVTLKATSVADGTKSATATITITAASTGPVSVTLTPKRGGLVVPQSMNFTATVTNDTGALGVTWSFTGNGSFSNADEQRRRHSSRPVRPGS